MDINEYNILASQIEMRLNQAGTLINFCVPGHLGYIELCNSFNKDLSLDHFVIRADIVIAKRKFVFSYPMLCDLFIYVGGFDLIGLILQKISECIQVAINRPNEFPENGLIISNSTSASDSGLDVAPANQQPLNIWIEVLTIQ